MLIDNLPGQCYLLRVTLRSKGIPQADQEIAEEILLQCAMCDLKMSHLLKNRLYCLAGKRASHSYVGDQLSRKVSHFTIMKLCVHLRAFLMEFQYVDKAA